MQASRLSWLVQRPRHALILALVLEAVIIVASHSDFAASDPLWYADLANLIAIDPSNVFAAPSNHPFEMRIGLTVPLAMIYRAFGVSVFTTNLPCLLAALGVMLVVYAAAPTPRAKLLGLLIVLACTPLLRHASMLNVDLPGAALMAASILFLAWRGRPRGAAWLVAAMVTWFAAFLVKESALWCAPVWIYAGVSDLRGAGLAVTARRFAPAIAAGAALAAGYLLLCAHVWGDPWARFAGIEELTERHAWSMIDRSSAEWIERLVWGTPLMLAQLFRATLIPAVLAAWLVRGSGRIWVVATASFVALFWFGSTSFSSYSPLPLSPRMMLPILPGILVLATLGADQMIERLQGSRWRAAIVAVLLAAIVIPAAFAIRFMIVRVRPETTAYAIVRELVEDPDRHVVLVCGDPRCPPISRFHFGFAPPPNLSIMFGADFAAAPQPRDVTVVVMVNLRRGTSSDWVDPAGVSAGYRVEKIEALALPALFRHREVRLYDAADGTRLWEALRATTGPRT